jgi:hypothetical protein
MPGEEKDLSFAEFWTGGPGIEAGANPTPTQHQDEEVTDSDARDTRNFEVKDWHGGRGRTAKRTE